MFTMNVVYAPMAISNSLFSLRCLAILNIVPGELRFTKNSDELTVSGKIMSLTFESGEFGGEITAGAAVIISSITFCL